MRMLFAALIPVGLWAQVPLEPPPFIQLVRKAGIATNIVRPYSDAGAAIHVLGLTSVTGLAESWFVEAHYNWASIEDLDKALAATGYRSVESNVALMDDEVLAPSRTILASLRLHWSYRADHAIRLFPRARYFQVTIYRIRAGTEADFGEL